MSERKKCIVLDLDNTLWGGVVGEDGAEGLALSHESPGSGFVAFQQALLDHYHRGVILAINSRNNPEEAWQVIREHPNMILKEPHFAAVRINWQDKTANLQELARELNIGLDSMVFIDDDPHNRALVRSLLPEVAVPELPSDSAEYARFLNSLTYFEGGVVTDEDTMRGNFYVTERLRLARQKEYDRKEDFLHSLGLQLLVYEDDDGQLPRLAQLTEKTNQFNTNKRILTEEDLAAYIRSPHHQVVYGKLQDVFGDYGIVLFALVEMQGSRWHIDSLLMSCRVFGRGAEDAFLAALAERARAAGAEELVISFIPTEKNMPAKEFVDTRCTNGTCILANKVAPPWIHTRYANF